MNRDPAPELMTYTLPRSFSHATTDPGHNSSSQITADIAGLSSYFLLSPLSFQAVKLATCTSFIV